jgi:hypothetical protein
MSNYTKATNFTAKDTLPTGDSSKIVKGQEIDTELTAVASAIASKADINSPTFTGTPAAPTASAGTSTTQIATTAFVTTAIANAAFPSGAIVLWSGSIASIPSGWYLCNGSNSTPDLRDRFIVGAGSTYSVDATGGSTTTSAAGSHDHTGTSGSTTLTAAQIEHYHGIGTHAGDDDWYLPDSGRSWSDDTTMQTSLITGNSGYGPSSNITSGNASTSDVNLNSPSGHTHTISSVSDHTHTITPPYYALAYIMKS